MFSEVKAMLPVSGDGYDGEIILQIKAAVLDLETSTEIRLPGRVNITRIWHDPVVTTESETPGYWQITDNSTLKDELAIVTIATWCNMHIGNPPNYEQLNRAYNSLKGQMRLSSRYNGRAEE